MSTRQAARIWITFVVALDMGSFLVAQFVGVPGIGSPEIGEVALSLAALAGIWMVLGARWAPALAFGVLVVVGSVFVPGNGAQLPMLAAYAGATVFSLSGAALWSMCMLLGSIIAVWVLARSAQTWPVLATALAATMLSVTIRQVRSRTLRTQHRATTLHQSIPIIRERELHSLTTELKSSILEHLGTLRGLGRKSTGVGPMPSNELTAEMRATSRRLLAEIRILVQALRQVDRAPQPVPRWARAWKRLSNPIAPCLLSSGALGLAVWHVAGLSPGLAPLDLLFVALVAFSAGLLGPLPAGLGIALCTVHLWAEAHAGTSPTGLEFTILRAYGALSAVSLGILLRHLIDGKLAAQRSARAAEAALRELLASDRMAVARELHDVVAHPLSVLTLRLARSEACSGDASAEDLSVVRETVDAAERDLIATMDALSHSDLALQSSPSVKPTEVARVMARTLRQEGFTCDCDIGSGVDELDPVIGRTITRTLQEACTNILRHAMPGSHCRVDVGMHGADVAVHVVNFIPKVPRSTHLSQGWGLIGLRERAELLGGTCTAGEERGRWWVRLHLPTEPGATKPH